MRTRVTLLVAATTSAVIVAFLVPLALLLRTLAEDRAVAAATAAGPDAARRRGGAFGPGHGRHAGAATPGGTSRSGRRRLYVFADPPGNARGRAGTSPIPASTAARGANRP